MSQVPLTIQFEKLAVTAGTRKLAANWIVELEQDIKAMTSFFCEVCRSDDIFFRKKVKICRNCQSLKRLIKKDKFGKNTSKALTDLL